MNSSSILGWSRANANCKSQALSAFNCAGGFLLPALSISTMVHSLKTEKYLAALDSNALANWRAHSEKWSRKFPWLVEGHRGIGCYDCWLRYHEELVSDDSAEVCRSLWTRLEAHTEMQVAVRGFRDHENSAEHQGRVSEARPPKQVFLDALSAVHKGQTELPTIGRMK